MSTETTNKKIKIDNGTTFGRTYTDKAVDELLKNVGGGQIIDINKQINPDGNTITQEGYDLIQQAYQNNTLLGISFFMFDTIEAVCMFDYVSLDIETMTNTYCFKFEAGETIIFKIKSDLTVTQSAQSSIAVYSQFTDLWYEGDYVSAIMSNETIYKIPYTLIYTSKDAYQNERLQFKNDTYDKTIYNIPTLPTDASSKNYALNSVNGALTWNTIGDGLEIKNGALQATGGGGTPILDMLPYYDANTQTISQEGLNLLQQKYINNEIVGVSFGAEATCMILDTMGATDLVFVGPYQEGHGSFKVSINMESRAVVNKWEEKINSLVLPTTTPTSQLIPSITTSNEQQNLTVGNGLEIKNGALQTSDLEIAVSITTTISDLQNAVNSFSNISYNKSDEAEINSFIKNQKGIMKLTIATPVGNLYMTLRPTLWKDDDANSYNFEGSLYIETDLSAIGGSTFNQIIVRAVTWDNGEVSFRPTILPIFDAIGDINTILDNINGEVI